MELEKSQIVHFSGVGGSGMSALARLFLNMGYSVSGSDLYETELTRELESLGVSFFLEQRSSNLENAHILVVSTAIGSDSPEIKEAQRRGLPIYKRAECLSWIMDQFKTKIAVTGTHGKTTTSSLLAWAYHVVSDKPSFAIGAVLNDFKANSFLGDSDIFIAEADESDGSFLFLNPTLAIVTNLEKDHMDYFETFDSLIHCFSSFIKNVIDSGGKLYLNADDPHLMSIAKALQSDQIIFFGVQHVAKYHAKNVEFSSEGSSFDLYIDGEKVTRIQLTLYGVHHVYNALSVLALMHSEGMSVELVKKALGSFSGVKRRLEFVGEYQGIQVFDDYGHHPTEIMSTLEGIKKSSNRRLICIFQPHRYSRTYYLLNQFTSAFDFADVVIIMDVYSAQEDNTFGVDSKSLVGNIKKHRHPDVVYIQNKEAISSYLIPKLSKGDLIVTMGAGDVHGVSTALLNELRC